MGKGYDDVKTTRKLRTPLFKKSHFIQLWERINPDSDEPILDQFLCAIEDEEEEKNKEYTKFMDDFCEEFMSLVNENKE